jgi:ATP-dependent Lon protease
VYLPARNEPDLDDVPAEVLEALTVHLIADVREILATALEAAVTAAPAGTSAA